MDAPTISIAPIDDINNIPTCSPNLMPFHIAYSGPAPISTYMRVKAAKEAVGAPSPEKHAAVKDARASENKIEENVDVEMAVSSSDVAKVTEEAAAVVATTEICDVEMTVSSSDTEKVIEVEPSMAVPATSVSTDISTPCTSSTSPAAIQPIPKVSSTPQSLSSSISKYITGATNRFVSTFRGRQIHGLKVDIPAGYVGLVLRSEDDIKGKGKSTSAKELTEKREAQERAKANGKSKAKANTRGRTRSSTAIIDADEKEEMVEAEADVLEHLDDDQAGNTDGRPKRTLVATSQFSSFVLWHADNPVNETSDEYFRSLTEWVTMAHEIHQEE